MVRWMRRKEEDCGYGRYNFFQKNTQNQTKKTAIDGIKYNLEVK
jgi:hypothetical protein